MNHLTYMISNSKPEHPTVNWRSVQQVKTISIFVRGTGAKAITAACPFYVI